MMLILGGMVAILAIVVIVWIVSSVKKDNPQYAPPSPAVSQVHPANQGALNAPSHQ